MNKKTPSKKTPAKKRRPVKSFAAGVSGRDAAGRNAAGTMGKVRIIGGEWRGRKLPVVNLPGLRPSGDRTRESLFNWLQPVLPGSRCLDLFAGTGVLGLEAASRGAGEVLLVERSRAVVAHLHAVVALLNAQERVAVVQADALAWMTQGGLNQPWDVVFVDPPWSSGLHVPVLTFLAEKNGLKNGALIYIEYPYGESLELPPQLHLQREKRFGQAQVCVVKKVFERT